MTVSVGDNIPSGNLKRLEEQGVKDINIQEYLENKKVVLFSVPGAFTPTCSAKHLPGFVEYYKDILDLGGNYNYINHYIGQSNILAVVKANAYGHGAIKISRVLEEVGDRHHAQPVLTDKAAAVYPCQARLFSIKLYI